MPAEPTIWSHFISSTKTRADYKKICDVTGKTKLCERFETLDYKLLMNFDTQTETERKEVINVKVLPRCKSLVFPKANRGNGPHGRVYCVHTVEHVYARIGLLPF